MQVEEVGRLFGSRIFPTKKNANDLYFLNIQKKNIHNKKKFKLTILRQFMGKQTVKTYRPGIISLKETGIRLKSDFHHILLGCFETESQFSQVRKKTLRRKKKYGENNDLTFVNFFFILAEVCIVPITLIQNKIIPVHQSSIMINKRSIDQF